MLLGKDKIAELRAIARRHKLETDEATEDGLICKRKRVAVAEPPAIESAAPDFVKNPPQRLHTIRVCWGDSTFKRFSC